MSNEVTNEVTNEVNQDILSLDENEIFTLIVKNEKQVQIKNREILYCSNVLKTALENDYKTNSITLPNIDDDLIDRVISYMQWHHDNPNKTTKIPENMYCLDWNIYIKEDKLSQWDYDFIHSFNTHDELIRLIKLADYLDINCLIYLSAAKIAQICKTYKENPKKLAEILGNTDWDEQQDKKEEEEFLRKEKEEEERQKKEYAVKWKKIAEEKKAEREQKEKEEK
jgi:hypothetical protein